MILLLYKKSPISDITFLERLLSTLSAQQLPLLSYTPTVGQHEKI